MSVDYKTIGHALQVEKDHVHVDKAFFNDQGFDVEATISRDEGVNLFNQTAEQNGLKTLVDPLGYMTLDDNVYDNIHDQYKEVYTNTIEQVNNGLISGGSYGMQAVLDDLNKKTRHDMSPFLPDKMKYSELRFIKATPEIKETVHKLAVQRVQITHDFGIRRSTDEQTLDRLKQNFNKTGLRLMTQLAGKEVGHEERRGLSPAELLKNGGNDKASLQVFAKALKEPEVIIKNEGDQHATAVFETSNINVGKFIMKNKDYLKDVGNFEVRKASGKIITSWQSERVDADYEAKHSDDFDLNLDGLDDQSGPSL